MLCRILRCNQIGNGFCSREVHLAVEESALRKFTRACHLATCRNEQLHGALNDILRPVAGNLHYVLASERVGCPEYTYHHLVQHLFPIHQVAEDKAITWALRERCSAHWMKKWAGPLNGFGTANTQNAERTASGGTGSYYC